MSILGFNPNVAFSDPQTGRLSLDGSRLMQAIVELLNGQRPIKLRSYTVLTVPAATKNPAALIYVSDEAGGAVVAFSDGADWRRLTDRAVIS